jgi:hypothetical protein
MDLIGWGEMQSMTNDGPVVRRSRRHFIREIGTKPTIDRFTPIINANIQEFLHKILNESVLDANLHHHVCSYVHLTTGYT